AAIRSAYARVSSSRRSAGTTRSSRPMRSASSASTRRLVSERSSARLVPTMRGSSHDMPPSGGRLRSWNTVTSRAESLPTRTSQEGKGESGASGHAVYRGDHRLIDVVERVRLARNPRSLVEQAVEVGAFERGARSAGDVSARTETLSGPGPEGDPGIIVVLDPLADVENVRRIGLIDRVHPLRLVERDRGDVGLRVDIEQRVGVRHAMTPFGVSDR